jgi:hypothetical protein
MTRRDRVAWAGLAMLWGAAFALATRLTATSTGTDAESVAGRVFGSARVALSGSSVEQADLYFHKGIGHVREEVLGDTLYRRWASVLRPTLHEHVEGCRVSEIMPWLRLATRMDPRNVEAYLTTAYWLRTAAKRPDLAEAVLMEAQRNSPGDYRILGARARLSFGRSEDRRAAALLDAGIGAWPGGRPADDPEVKQDLAQMLSYRAFLHELDGDRTNALALFRRSLDLFPENGSLAERVAAMERGEDFSARDRATWDLLFKRSTEKMAEDESDHPRGCSRELAR